MTRRTWFTLALAPLLAALVPWRRPWDRVWPKSGPKVFLAYDDPARPKTATEAVMMAEHEAFLEKHRSNAWGHRR